jgi:hypothetical protein
VSAAAMFNCFGYFIHSLRFPPPADILHAGPPGANLVLHGGRKEPPSGGSVIAVPWQEAAGG